MARRYDAGEPLPGDRFGRLVAVERGPNAGKHRRWRFRCDCGKESLPRLSAVKTGRVVSCGCAVKGRAYPSRFPSLAEALASRILATDADACWPWQGCIGGHGYGVLRFQRRLRLAHRASYEVNVGPVPDELDVLHDCDNRPCCNPRHLFLGTQKDNNEDKVAKMRHSYGEGVPTAKLTVEQARRIRDHSGLSNSEIAKLYGVSRRAVGDIRNGKTWAAALR